MVSNRDLTDMDERIRELEKSMAGCRRVECSKDHDRLTQMITIIEQKVEADKELIKTVSRHNSSIETMGGNLNQVASIVQDMMKSDKAKRTFFLSITSGILIALLSALLLYSASILKAGLKAELSVPVQSYTINNTDKNDHQSKPIYSEHQKGEIESVKK